MISDLTTYASITSIRYNHIRGCPSGHTRVIWGWNTDPVDARRVQANCFPNRMLR